MYEDDDYAFAYVDTVEIYRLSTGSWEVINYKATFCFVGPDQVDINGISYWITYDSEDNPLLVSFDGNEESFGFMDLDLLVYQQPIRLILLKESLVIVTPVDRLRSAIWTRRSNYSV